MPKQTYLANTAGGDWVTVVAGEATVVSVVANATAATTLVALRIKLANGDVGYFLPLNSLPFNKPARIAISGISLKPGDKLEALSNTAVDWVATAIPGTAFSSVVAASPATEVWTQLVAGPAVVRGIYVSAASPASVGVRLSKGGKFASLVLSEDILTGGSKRFMAPVVLAAGDSIQVKSSAQAFWVGTGVEVTV